MGRLTNGSLLGEHQPSDLDLVDIEPPGALAGPVRGVAGACLPTPRLYATREDLRVHRRTAAAVRTLTSPPARRSSVGCGWAVRDERTLLPRDRSAFLDPRGGRP